jgi:hypothetical protein
MPLRVRANALPADKPVNWRSAAIDCLQNLVQLALDDLKGVIGSIDGSHPAGFLADFKAAVTLRPVKKIA